MKRAVWIGLVLVLCIAGTLWFALPYLGNAARQGLERVASEGLGEPAHIGKLSVSLFPVAVHLEDGLIGGEPSPLARLGAADVRLSVLASLLQWRPVLTVRINSATFDVTQLPASTTGTTSGHDAGGGAEVPSLRLRAVELEDVRILFPFEAGKADLQIKAASGSVSSRSRTRRLNAVLNASGLTLMLRGRQLEFDAVQVEGGLDRGQLFAEKASLNGKSVALALTSSSSRQYQLSADVDLDPVGSLLGRPLKGRAKLSGRLEGSLLDPDFNGRLAIEGLRAEGREIGNVSADLRRGPQTLQVQALRLAGPLGHLVGDVEVGTSGAMPLKGTLRLHQVDLDALLSLVGEHLNLQHVVTGTASVEGSLNPLTIDVTAEGALRQSEGGLPPASEPSDETADVNDPPDPPGTVADASVEPSSTPRATPSPGPRLSGSGPGAESQPPAATFKLDAHLESGRSDVRVEVEQPQGNSLRAEIVSKGEQLSGPVQLQVHDLTALSRLLPKPIRDLGLTGEVEGSVTLSGSPQAPNIEARLSGKRISIMGVQVPRLAGEVSIVDATLSTDGLRVDTANGNLLLEGRLALDQKAKNDWRLEINGLDTDFVVGSVTPFVGGHIPVSGGKLDGAVAVKGSWPQAMIDGHVVATSLYLEQEPLESLEVDVTASLPQWKLNAVLTHVEGEKLTVAGSGSGMGGLDITVSSTPVAISHFRRVGRRQASGTIEVQGHLTGSAAAPEGNFSISGTELTMGERQLGNVELRAVGSRREWKVTVVGLAGAIQADATVQMRHSYPYVLNVRWEDAALARLVSTDPSLQVTTSGEIRLSGSLTDWQRPNGSIEITHFDVVRDQYHVTAPQPIHIDAEHGVFRIQSFELSARETRVTLTGNVSLTGQVHLQARGEGDLVLLELVGRPINSARGRFTVMAGIDKAPERPWSLEGDAHLSDATVDLGLPVAFTAVNGDFTLTGAKVRVDRLEGRAGGGRFVVGGSADFERGPDLTWSLQQVALSPEDGLEAQLSGKGGIAGSWRSIVVNGGLHVVSALYDRNVELTDLLPSLRAKVMPAPRTQPPAIQVRFDLLIYSSGEIFIDNNVAKAEMWLNLHLGGDAEEPVLRGTIGFLNGEVTFRKRTFTITAGSVDFREERRINPILNITAESEIATAEADYTVAVTVTGAAENPRVQLSADDPNLSQNDILSLITFGKTTAQLQREGGGVSAVDALALLPTGAATNRIGKLIGVDQFEVEATQGRNSGAIEPRVSIGKDLTDRLRVSLSSSFGVDAQQAVQVEYRLTRGMSLLGSWEGQTRSQAGAFGGGVKFRHEFRKLPLLDLLPGGLKATTDRDEK